jgi:hypothetical protein
MGENTLLALATSYLLTEEGKKLIGEGLDISSFKSQLQSRLQLIADSTSAEGVNSKPNATREERRKIRQEKRQVKKDQTQEKKDQINQYIPELKDFNIKGRIYDKKENTPLQGVKIEVLIENPIYLKLSEQEYSTSTLEDGTFEINISLPILPLDGKILLQPKFLYTKDGYLPGTQEILTLGKEAKSDLNLYPLVNLETAGKEELSSLINSANKKIKEVNNIALDLSDKIIVAKRKAIMNVVSIIQTRLFPLALSLLLAFGITKLTQKNQKICPTRNLLLGNIAKRNRIVKQLNQIFVTISLNTALATALTLIVAQFRAGRLSISLLPIPLISQPYSVISKLQQVEDVLKELEEQNKELNKQILIALIFLVASLIIILTLLKGIDELTQECAQEENIDLEPISQELTSLTNEANEEGIISVDKINGFTLEVQSLDQNVVGKLKRRQAIGKNAQGIILVKGDPSFSSSDQILINELAFYIQSNNLKAF